MQKNISSIRSSPEGSQDKPSSSGWPLVQQDLDQEIKAKFDNLIKDLDQEIAGSPEAAGGGRKSEVKKNEIEAELQKLRETLNLIKQQEELLMQKLESDKDEQHKRMSKTNS